MAEDYFLFYAAFVLSRNFSLFDAAFVLFRDYSFSLIDAAFVSSRDFSLLKLLIVRMNLKICLALCQSETHCFVAHVLRNSFNLLIL